MKKSDIIKIINKKRIVAVIRGDDYDSAIKTCKECISSGLTTIEMAYTNNHASEIIATLNKEYKDILIGAGTVLDASTARLAIMSGAKFIVSPSFDKETAFLCNKYAIPYSPGCMSVNEVVNAMKYGSEIVKIFPATTLGISMVKAIRSPLSQVTLMATGGINLNNMKEWYDAGVECLGVGGELNTLASKKDYKTLRKIARAFVEIAT